MKVAVVLLRGMVFSQNGATSIDLVARDLFLAGGYGNEAYVIGAKIDQPFDDVDFRAIDADGSKSFLKRAAQLLESETPDLVVVHQHPESAAALAKMIAPVPVVLHRHGLLRHKRGFFSKWRKGRQFRQLAGVLFVSDFLRQRFLENYPQFADRAHVVWNGIDTEFWKPGTAKQRTIAFVGRARADKGILELISAFSALEADDWSLELGLAVQTEDERQLFDRLKGQISASDTINIRKNLSSTEVRDLLSRSAIAALPSIVEEGFHRAVIEAMACGCATIATQRGGAPEAAGTAGVLLPPLEGRALSQELQATLKQLIETGEERQRLSDIGRQHALERADIDVIADQHFKILQSI